MKGSAAERKVWVPVRLRQGRNRLTKGRERRERTRMTEGKFQDAKRPGVSDDSLPVKIRRKAVQSPKDRITIRKKREVVYLTFPLLENQPGLVHGVSTRLGGVSCGDVGSMNVSFAREENQGNVRENHRRLAEAIGYEPENLVFSMQTHTTNIRLVTEKERGIGFSRPQDETDVDGLITNVPNVALMTFYADCVPLLLYDPLHRAIGCAHSGWRGTVENMGCAVVEAMREAYGSNPADILAAIGPSICQDCYEVSADVIEKFKDAYPKDAWPFLFYEKPDGKYQLNLQEACFRNFLRAGLNSTHISLPDLCTCCNPQFLFSHRASHGKRGNLGAVIMLKSAE